MRPDIRTKNVSNLIPQNVVVNLFSETKNVLHSILGKRNHKETQTLQYATLSGKSAIVTRSENTTETTPCLQIGRATRTLR